MASGRLTVIGGGPGGYTAAFAAARQGMEVTLAESDSIGGTCLNAGCIPTKTLKTSSDVLGMTARLAEFGLKGNMAEADMTAIQTRKKRVMATLRAGLERTCATLKIRMVHGRGRLINAKQVVVTGGDGVETLVNGDMVILATGSRTLELPDLPFDHEVILNSDDILDLKKIPKRLLIAGGGVIGCEMAFIFKSFGSDICLVEAQARPLPLVSIDADISDLLQLEMKKRHIHFCQGRVVSRVRQENGAVVVTLSPSPFSANPSQAPLEVEVDAVLVTVGRKPNTEQLGLEEAGVKLDERRWVVADEFLETSVRGVYAVGDLLGPQKSMLAHVASMEGLCAASNCLGKRQSMDYGLIPSAVFTKPEIGCVGLTEKQAKDLGIKALSYTFQMRQLGKMQVVGELSGICKIVADADGLVLGVHIAGPCATELVAGPTLAVKMKTRVADVVATMHAHPTLAEGFFESASGLAASYA
ncbi:MAG: dihydrolipoyl dehydrogenase [Desulfovibrio sp.]|jgi:dihydrolipoamide dehydrogenase|nr:dihydrolipoyl dehydrogenase [Desulfovibrio sp.]